MGWLGWECAFECLPEVVDVFVFIVRGGAQGGTGVVGAKAICACVGPYLFPTYIPRIRISVPMTQTTRRPPMLRRQQPAHALIRLALTLKMMALARVIATQRNLIFEVKRIIRHRSRSVDRLGGSGGGAVGFDDGHVEVDDGGAGW